jgi:hypothetical protein
MKRKIRVIQQIFTLIGLVAIFISCETVERDIYQLKIYRLNSSDQELRMDDYLQTAYIPALKRIGIKHIGVFKEIADIDSVNKLIYVFTPFKTINQFEQLEGKLKLDNKYLVDGKDYIDSSHDNAPYERIESILLKSFESMKKYGVPNHESPNSERIYELRSYQAATEKLYHKKVEMFNKGGESKIFIGLGFQPIFFGEVISGPSMPNLMYLTTFENKTSHENHWNAFRNSPDWLLLKEDGQYDNTVSKNEKFYLYPTDYSDL